MRALYVKAGLALLFELELEFEPIVLASSSELFSEWFGIGASTLSSTDSSDRMEKLDWKTGVVSMVILL